VPTEPSPDHRETQTVGERTDARLRDLDGQPVDEHAAIYETVHADLTEALT